MKLRLLALSSVAMCAVIVACSGDDAAEGPATGAPEPSGTAAPEPGTPPADPVEPLAETAGEVDAGPITEGGGGNPDEEPDAGGFVVVLDAGAFCGPAAGNGASLTSACSSQGILFNGGGVITPGTYDLAAFTVTGTDAYCGTYMPNSYAGRLDVKDDGKGGFILAERVARLNAPTTTSSKTFTATSSGSILSVAQTCGSAIKAKSWGYTVSLSGGKGGKPTINYTHDLGSATVRYKWVMR